MNRGSCLHENVIGALMSVNRCCVEHHSGICKPVHSCFHRCQQKWQHWAVPDKPASMIYYCEVFARTKMQYSWWEQIRSRKELSESTDLCQAAHFPRYWDLPVVKHIWAVVIQGYRVNIVHCFIFKDPWPSFLEAQRSKVPLESSVPWALFNLSWKFH